MQLSNNKTAILLATVSTMAFSSPAFAQLDEIIVTAEKRTENLQDVPIAIAAFDLQALETFRIEGVQDIGTFTPGVYVTPSPADPTGVRVNIRGVGTLDPQVGQDSRVAIYQDGVYLGKTQGLAFDLPDLERVEILKGPQGTLYGRNTVAGAVNLISARPDPTEFTGKIRAEYGNFDHKKLSAAVNIPLAETAALRISGLFNERDGWVENNGPGTDFGGEQKYGFRAAVGFDVGRDWNLEIAGDFNNTQTQPLFYQSVTGFGEVNPLFGPAITTFDDGRQEETTTSFVNETGELETYGVTAVARWDVAEGHDVKFTAAYREVESERFVSLIPTANPDIINAITGGFNQAIGALPFAFGAAGQPLRSDFSTQFDGSIPDAGLFLSPPGGTSSLDDHSQTSLEATYNGNFLDGKLEFTGGAFYFNEDTGIVGAGNPANANDYLFVLGQFSPAVTAPNITGFLGANGIPPAAQGPIPAAGILLSFLQSPLAGQAFPLVNQLVGNGTTCQQTGMTPAPANNFCIPTLSVALDAARQTTTNSLRIQTDAYAVYGQATYHVTDDFRITGGLRYSDESKDGQGQANSAFFNDAITLTGNLIEPNIGSFDDTILDPSLTLEYDFTDDILLYASYKESFRSGGFNATASGLRLPGETFGADFTFEKETLTAYEGGFKAEFGDRIRLNASGYYYDFADKQTTLGLNPLIATERAIVNTDDEIYGFEVDGTFAVTDAITLRGSYAFIDGTAGDTVNPLNSADVRSFPELQGTPENSALAAIDYNGGNGLFGNLTYSYTDDVLAIPENALRFPSINLVSGNIGYNFQMPNGTETSITFWGQNLFDEEYLIDSLPFETFAFRTEVFGTPRTYGVTLGVNF